MTGLKFIIIIITTAGILFFHAFCVPIDTQAEGYTEKDYVGFAAAVAALLWWCDSDGPEDNHCRFIPGTFEPNGVMARWGYRTPYNKLTDYKSFDLHSVYNYSDHKEYVSTSTDGAGSPNNRRDPDSQTLGQLVTDGMGVGDPPADRLVFPFKFVLPTSKLGEYFVYGGILDYLNIEDRMIAWKPFDKATGFLRGNELNHCSSDIAGIGDIETGFRECLVLADLRYTAYQAGLKLGLDLSGIGPDTKASKGSWKTFWYPDKVSVGIAASYIDYEIDLKVCNSAYIKSNGECKGEEFSIDKASGAKLFRSYHIDFNYYSHTINDSTVHFLSFGFFKTEPMKVKFDSGRELSLTISENFGVYAGMSIYWW